MLSRFYIKNFRSILELDISFANPHDSAFGNGNNEWSKTGPFPRPCVPCLAIYGPNAGGKSSIIEAFLAFKDMLGGDPCRDHYNPNRLYLNSRDADTEMTMEWADDTAAYRYTVRYGRENFNYEAFEINGKLCYLIKREQTQFSALATATYPQELLHTIFETECADHERLYLPVLVGRLPGLHQVLTKAYRRLYSTLHVHRTAEIPLQSAFDELFALAADTEEKEMQRQEVLDWVQRLDIDIEQIKYNTEKVDFGDYKRFLMSNHYELAFTPDGPQALHVETLHRDQTGALIPFGLKEESQGTQILMKLCCLMLVVLKQGGILVIDEIDRSLHPMLLKSIVRTFKRQKQNPHNAQLIFSTHTTDLLEQGILHPAEIGIISKSRAQGTTFTRLVNFKGVENTADYREPFSDGKFGGIPYPY